MSVTHLYFSNGVQFLNITFIFVLFASVSAAAPFAAVIALLTSMYLSI